MKKRVAAAIILALACAAAPAAQEAGSPEPLFNIDGVKKALPFNFNVYGKAMWAPLVYRGDRDGVVNSTVGEGPGFGVGSGPGWDNIGAAIGFDSWGSNEAENIGFELRLRAKAGDGDVYAGDNMAYLWARPFDQILKIQFGMYRWDDLRGKIGGIGEVAGGYGGDEDSIFQRLESDTFGAMFILTPPSVVPAPLQGLMLFSSFGVSGGLDPAKKEFAAATEKALKYIFSTPHAGIAYRNDVFGLARLQFIASKYHWGEGEDWLPMQTQNNVLGYFANGKYYYPSHSQDAARLELAANITCFPNINLDLGFGLPFPVKVVAKDNGEAQKTGPLYRELGYRTIGDSVYNNNYLADEAGDVWQPPVRVAAGLDFKLPDLGLGFRFRAKMEFGEQIAFADGSETFKGGFDMEFGLEPSYVVGRAGVLLLDVAFRANQNDSFKGKKNLTTSNQVAQDSLSHNGVMDLGLGAFFRRDFKKGCYIKAGVSATVPLGGDRYEWSPGGAADADIKDREAVKKGQTIIAVPIIIEMNLF
ncbi:MAG: hypothetical protein LBF63_06135 [Treponema sp.]|jgi:hypothetical protein|nr:hypothetical protein [Treponema sp.]